MRPFFAPSSAEDWLFVLCVYDQTSLARTPTPEAPGYFTILDWICLDPTPPAFFSALPSASSGYLCYLFHYSQEVPEERRQAAAVTIQKNYRGTSLCFSFPLFFSLPL